MATQPTSLLPEIEERMNEIGRETNSYPSLKLEPFLIPESSPVTGAESLSIAQSFSIPADLSIALIGPDMRRRMDLAAELADCGASSAREFLYYPSRLEILPQLIETKYDVILIELDTDPEFALELVENVCANGSSTVMVYSQCADQELMLRSMRAGAREFLSVPLQSGAVVEALVRAAARRPARASKKTGKLLAFMGAKGGVGVTSVACNFAVALAQDAAKKTLLIDLDLPLGDAALNLGIIPAYSTVNALQEADRLDAGLLSKLLVRHNSGVFVLAAPGKFQSFRFTGESLSKLLSVARQEFDNVVVDAGSRLDMSETTLFQDASTIYLVTQAGIPELRNSNRLINQYFSGGNARLEVVLNRYESRKLDLSEDQITKALTRPIQWRVPNDHALVRKMQINAKPLVLGDSSVARLIKKMAQAVDAETGANPAAPPQKKAFKLFG